MTRMEPYQAAIEAAPLAVVTTTTTGVVTAWNPAAEALFGWTAGEAIGNPLPCADRGEFEEDAARLRERLLQGEIFPAYETRRRCRDGSVVEVSVSAAPVCTTPGELTGLVFMYRDVGATKRAEAAAHAASVALRAMIDDSPLAIVTFTLDGIVTSWNRTAERMYGWTSEEVCGGGHPGMKPGQADGFEWLRREVLSDRIVVDQESRRRRKDGGIVDVSVSAAPQRDASGAVVGLVVTCTDISTRKRLETALRTGRARFDALFRTTHMGLAILDTELRYIEINPMLASINQMPAEAHIGRSVMEMVPWAAPALMPVLRDVIATGKPVRNLEVTIPAGSAGRPGSYLCSYIPLFAEDGAIEGLGAMVMDVTDHRSLEEQLRQSQKMEAVGRLAGGIAHDFNNLLSVIQTGVDLLRQDLAGDSGSQEDLQLITEAAARAAGLTNQLLAFCRRQPMAPRLVDVNEAVSGMRRLLERLWLGSINVEISTRAEYSTVFADPVHLEQVVMNLGVNARDAMPDGGVLRLETEEQVLTEDLCHTHGIVPPGRYLRLTVQDSGRGMDTTTLSRLFEPFFTTKARGAGTGLGLSIVHGIVKQIGGHVTVQSALGQGTTFSLYLPQHDRRERARLETRTRPALWQGTETILVVDDEEAVRRGLSLVLRRQGYVVHPAGSGAEAIELCHRHGSAIQLLITDLVMPGMSGAQLGREVRAAMPGLPVLFISGYDDEGLELRDGQRFLRKPFGMSELCRAVRELLDARVAVI